MRKLPAASVDLVFADPPYFLSNGGTTCRAGARAKVNKGSWDRAPELDEQLAFTLSWLAEAKRLLKPSGTIWVSGTQHSIFITGYALQQLGFRTLNVVTWYKPNAPPNLGCRCLAHSTELLIWASPNLPKRNRRSPHVFNYAHMRELNGGKQLRDLWAVAGSEEGLDDGQGRVWSMLPPAAAEKAFGRHPTQKPLALLERIVDACTSPGDSVLDPFCGSGTTGVAAVSRGCSFTGIDRERKYIALATRRIWHLQRES